MDRLCNRTTGENNEHNFGRLGIVDGRLQRLHVYPAGMGFNVPAAQPTGFESNDQSRIASQRSPDALVFSHCQVPELVVVDVVTSPCVLLIKRTRNHVHYQKIKS